ncbi:sodium-dependent transporter [Natribacillus halophilus]|uniref:Neurotransmitter:Na+ symporter, NSS family n=1 Tax=Natribacillus halophilus TaxID=549003 RepID=A0A1G8RMM8_9BACI|nr:sodium-dependent transporter [Natribacillus halophilus]SDJ18258.1 neurotransmitter:Na+ symporter, NSS family [Natribacillus halophilus]
MQEREKWATRYGFMLAAVASAVGLGNIWRFPYITGELGGGAFLVVYIVCILIIGLPTMIAEFSIGKRGQLDAVGSFQKTTRSKPWVIGGWLGVITSFLIVSFYAVITGWVLYYMFSYLVGTVQEVEPGGIGEFFEGFIGHDFLPVIWQVVVMAIIVGILYFGVQKGIELSNKIFMPALAVILIILAGYSLSLGGAAEGLSFLFIPDWSAFANPDLYLAAVGQAFFTLSLGMGIMVTYGGYLSNQTGHRLPGMATGIVIMDTLFAIVVGIVIFAAIFAIGGIEVDQGPTLIFAVLPEVFNQMAGAGGTFFAVVFFFLVFIAGLSSAISLAEVSISFAIRRFNLNRKKAAIIVGAVITAVGVPSALSQGGPLGDVLIAGETILDFVDILTDSYFLPIGGLIVVLFVGWGWKRQEAFETADFKNQGLGKLWLFLIRFVAPIMIIIILLANYLGIGV